MNTPHIAIVDTGSDAFAAALALDEAGIKSDRRGGIVIDDHMHTNVENRLIALVRASIWDIVLLRKQPSLCETTNS